MRPASLNACIGTGERREIIEDCVELILRSGIKRVVFGTQDGHKSISGRGIERLMLNLVEVQRCERNDEMKRKIDNLSGGHRFSRPPKPQNPIRSRLR